MPLTPLQIVVMVLAVAVGTQLTRWLPFAVFPEDKEPPKVILYLGHVLPPAMMGLLVAYCLRNVSLAAAPHGIPEAIALAVVAGFRPRGPGPLRYGLTLTVPATRGLAPHSI